MLDRLTELAQQRADFAFETTMASRSFVPRLTSMAAAGYRIAVIFVWLNSPELAIRRVSGRVKRGGHFVPLDVIRRRYERGISNFVNLYRPLADAWRVYDNSDYRKPRLVAHSVRGEFQRVFDRRAFDRIEEIAHGASGTAQDDS
jgi:predicted ABC-type ATPase